MFRMLCGKTMGGEKDDTRFCLVCLFFCFASVFKSLVGSRGSKDMS